MSASHFDFQASFTLLDNQGVCSLYPHTHTHTHTSLSAAGGR